MKPITCALRAAPKQQLVLATAFTFVFMMGFALSNSMYSTLLPHIIEQYAFNLKQASALTIASDAGQSGAMLATLLLADRMDKRRLLVWMALAYGVTLLLTAGAPAYLLLLATRFSIGLSGGLVDNLCATYISDLYGMRRGRYISILHTLFAVASMAAPSFAALCITVGGWQASYWVSGILLVVSALLFVLLTALAGAPAAGSAGSIPPPPGGAARKIPYRTILSSPLIRWLCLASALLASVTYLTIWLPTYLDWRDSGVYTVAFCTILMTSNYIGMIVSRTVFAIVETKMSPEDYLRWSSLISAVLIAVLVVLNQPVLWLAGLFFFGVLSGASYTARVVLACKIFPAYSATATAVTGICGTLGSTAISAVIGILADCGLYTAGMFIPPAALLGVFLVFTFGARRFT